MWQAEVGGVWSQAGLDKKHEILSKNKLKAKRDQVVEP
jgi:hypothetical protein